MAAKRDTVRWCRGKEGVEHEWVLVPGPMVALSGKGCGFRPYVEQRTRRSEAVVSTVWVCLHEERCEGCKRVRRGGWDIAPEECPTHEGS